MWEMTKTLLMLLAGSGSLLLAATGKAFREDTPRPRALAFAWLMLVAWLSISLVVIGMTSASPNAALDLLGCLLGVNAGLWLVVTAMRRQKTVRARTDEVGKGRALIIILALLLVDVATVSGLMWSSEGSRLLIVIGSLPVTAILVAAYHWKALHRFSREESWLRPRS